MKLSSKLILFVVLPMLVVLVGVAGWLRTDHRARAVGRAQAAIEQTTASAAALISRDLANLDATLKSVLDTIDGPLEPDSEQAERLTRSCRAILRNHTGLLGLELFNGASQLIFSLTAPGSAQLHVPASGKAELQAAQQTGIDLIWLRDQRARLVSAGEAVHGRSAPTLTALLHVPTIVSPAAALASRLHPGSWIDFSSPDRGSTYTTLTSRHESRPTVLSASRYLEQPAALGTLRVVQPRALALAAAALDTMGAFTGLGVTVLALLAILAIGLNSTILRPVKTLLATVSAFERGEALPDTAGTSRDELGTLSMSLRSALLDVAESQRRLQRLNSQLETRVGERTGQLRRYTRELRHARTETDAANKARAEFLANISHEVRTPLNGIIGMTELLLDSNLNKEQREYTQSVQRAGNEMLRLMTDVLDFSRLKRRQVELEETDFPLESVIEEICEPFANEALHKDLSLTCDISRLLPKVVRGDNERLSQILTRLLGNAIKFTEQGTIALRVTPGAPTHEGIELRFEVSDSGIGIPAEACQRLFEPFHQEDSSSTRKYGGTGISLAMCQLLAESLGGTIGVDSTVGEGSTFWVTTVFEQVGEDDISETRARALLNGLRVLVVDDRAMNRMIFSRECKGWGMEPIEAESGAEALELASSAFGTGHGFDLVLLDMQMPRMNGLQTARCFKDDPALAAIPLVMLTSTSTAGSDGRAEDQDAGIAARLIKPIHQQQLLSCLTRLLTERLPASLPAPEVAPGPGTPAEEPTRSPTRSTCRRILIVEDNVVNQMVAQRLLKKLGYEADVVNNGAEAVEAVAAQTYGAVLMDCQMPVMDGFEATGEIRRCQEGERRIPVLAMTASGLLSDRQTALAAGMDDFITKPVMTDELEQLLARWIEPESCLVAAAPSAPSLASSTGGSIADEEQQSSAPLCDQQPMSNPAPSSPPPTDDVPSPIDDSVLDELRAFQSDDGPDILTELIDIFLDDTPPRLAAMISAVTGGDPSVAESEGHALKSSCAQLGATALSDLCRQVEMAGKQGDLDAAHPAVDQAQAEFERVVTALQAMRKVA